MRGTGIAVRTLVLAFIFCGPTVSGGPRHCDDRSFTEVDKVIAVELFTGQIRVYGDGSERWLISESWPSSFGIDPERMPAYYAYVMRAQAAAKVHRELLKTDPDYRRRWNRATAEVLSKLRGRRRVSYREGTQTAYPIFLRACIYQDIFRRLGPPTVTDEPYTDGKDDPEIWGREDVPFFSVDRLDRPRWPASVQPFHYCAGTGGLTVTGGEAEPHVRAWKWLMAHDEEFRAQWQRVQRIVAEEAAKVDPRDAEAGDRVTEHWRELLLEGGEGSLAARIERRVAEEAKQEGAAARPAPAD